MKKPKTLYAALESNMYAKNPFGFSRLKDLRMKRSDNFKEATVYRENREQEFQSKMGQAFKKKLNLGEGNIFAASGRN